MADQFAPNHKLCYRCQGSGRERGVFYGKDPGDCMDCGGKGVVFKGTPPSPTGLDVPRAVNPPEFQEVSYGVDSVMRPVKGMAISEYAFRQWAKDVGIVLAAGVGGNHGR